MNERKEICKKCENLDKGLIDTCKVCGCPIFIITEIQSRKCPKGKW